MNDQNCPICSVKVNQSGSSGGADIYDYDCPVCGRFSIKKLALHYLRSESRDERTSAVISHAIRRMQKQSSWPEIDTKMLDTILQNNELPSPIEQADNLIILIGDNIKIPGKYITLNPNEQRSIIGSANERNFNFVVGYLKEKGFLKSKTTDQRVTLSFDGWSRYDNIKHQSSESRKAFMAMPYGNDLIDKVYRDYFKKATSQTGFKLHRLDEKPKAGSIDDRLRIEIRTSRFLIAELAEGNHGVYWEAGFAEGLGKPVIYTCEKSYFNEKKTHFDTNHLHTVLWSDDELDEAANQLKITIRATLPDEAKLEDE